MPRSVLPKAILQRVRAVRRRLVTAAADAVDRWLAPGEGTTAVRALRLRLGEERARGPVTRAERSLALALRRNRERLADGLGALHACAGCAASEAPPLGRWPGGFCCSGRTEALFDEEELAALSAAGTRPRHLRRYQRDPAGCVFRGPTGCALPPRHRPNRCLRYVCHDLSRELFDRGALDALEAAAQENRRLLAAFCEARAERLSRTFCRDLEQAVATRSEADDATGA